MINNFFQINKLSVLHNNQTVFFCKTDYLLEDFNTIQQLNNDVILITGNSDYAITEDLVKIAPKNIIRWYAQNALPNSEILEPIPIGLENKLESYRLNHGVGYYERTVNRESLIKKYQDYTSLDVNQNKIYANFNINTNVHYRGAVRNIIDGTNHIVWEEPNHSLENYYQKMTEFDMILCPIGNGVDTHRLWEVLYCNRIPVTIKINNFKIYELYNKMPIILLDKIEDLYDIDLILNKKQEIKSKKYDLSILDTNYWIKDIIC
jgi:hypothetical protein